MKSYFITLAIAAIAAAVAFTVERFAKKREDRAWGHFMATMFVAMAYWFGCHYTNDFSVSPWLATVDVIGVGLVVSYVVHRKWNVSWQVMAPRLGYVGVTIFVVSAAIQV